MWWKPACGLAYADDDPDVEETPRDATSSQRARDLPTGCKEPPFVFERRMMMLQALTRWSTHALIGDKWKSQIKADVQVAIRFSLDEVERILCRSIGRDSCVCN